MAGDKTTEREMDLVRKIFELDAQYQGGVIKSANRETFLREHIYPALKIALDEAYVRGYQVARHPDGHWPDL